ncbi:MAG: flagellar basal body rod protein FlgC [Gammaproteobacteria bacterium]|nr:flagellar basal body rod protein FlgC [Gammaproteobacteria bacterium]MDH5730102.1 flagellar basal body rod protein FlgC [Gammaproteobacteria bacterium]
MDYLSAFQISASGMALEKLRLDTVAMNLANANVSAKNASETYRPLRVISNVPIDSTFNKILLKQQINPQGVTAFSVQPDNVEPKLVYDPSHPHADDKGYVAYPNINTVSEMVTMLQALRTYDANVAAMNAAKSMANRALEIGR